MDQDDVIPVDIAKEMVWTLSPDRKTVRLAYRLCHWTGYRSQSR